MELLYLAAGLGIGYLIFKPKKAEKEKAPLVIEDQKEQEESELDPMTLRNDFGVYRGDKPTWAEQWVNIINYNGENQKEGDYE